MDNFTARLEPFLLISKSAKGAAAAKLIQDATSAPGVFVFTELLELPNIQEARPITTSFFAGLTSRSACHQRAACTVSLTLAALCVSHVQGLSRLIACVMGIHLVLTILVTEHKDSLPSLNQAQITKLKYLTIVTLAMERHILSYSVLLEELRVTNIRELEDLIIDAIYLDILRGKLDQKEQQLEIEYTMGRDLEPGKLEKLLEALQNWASTTAAVLSELDQKLMETGTYTAMAQVENEEQEKVYQASLKDVQERLKDNKGGRRGTGPNNIDSMDVDEPASEGIRIRNRKYVTFFSFRSCCLSAVAD
ncbi:hypothetical protein JVU11DRAFT_9428 [Chiua virens]|nr:hypothetical protein JVU11DRAFT_9428 [Chiua virens]